MLVDWLIFAGACIFLIISGNFLVRSLTKLSQFLRLNEFVVGFLLMAFSTSLPELMVGISAALIKEPALVLGNVIGSNIANLTIVVGITAILGRGLKGGTKIIRKDSYWMVGIVTLAMVLMYIGRQLSRFDAVILLLVSGFYFYKMITVQNRYKPKKMVDNINRWAVLGYFLIFIISLPVLFISADYLVKSGIVLSLDLAMPPIFVGLFFIALGTSLPELAFGSFAVLKGHHELAVGNIIGSVIINSTIVLAVAALITPISGNIFLFLTSSAFMLVMCLLFAVFLESGGKIAWKEGLVLVFMYILFIIIEFSLKNYYLLNGV